MVKSVFEAQHDAIFKYRFAGQLHVGRIAGGTPKDPKVAEGWLKTKLGLNTDDQIQTQVAEVMVKLNVTADEAVKKVDENRHLNGFYRDEDRGLYIEGRQLKAAIKEAVSVGVAGGHLDNGRSWGKTKKTLLGFAAEHIFVVEDQLYLGAMEPSGVMQRFVHTWRGTGIQYEEYVDGATIDFTVISDYDFKPNDWASIWVEGEQQGIGASRSQGYGKYKVVKWDLIT